MKLEEKLKEIMKIVGDDDVFCILSPKGTDYSSLTMSAEHDGIAKAIYSVAKEHENDEYGYAIYSILKNSLLNLIDNNEELRADFTAMFNLSNFNRNNAEHGN